MPAGSVYGPTIERLCESFVETLEVLRNVHVEDLPSEQENDFLSVVYHQEFGLPSVETEVVKELFSIVSQHKRTLEKGNLSVHISMRLNDPEYAERRRLNPVARFLVGTDGSRMSPSASVVNNIRLGSSFYAFLITTQLRRHGSIHVVYVDKHDTSLPEYSSEFILSGSVRIKLSKLRL